MIPSSFAREGFVTADQARLGGRKFRRLLIAVEGESDTGKSEFSISAPGPGLAICIDRGFDALFDNPRPPATRNPDFRWKIVPFSGADMTSQANYLEQWQIFTTTVYKAISIPECRTVIIDGDSDSWELQRLAEHGKLTGVFPQTKFAPVYAARRGFYYRLWDSGKIIIATNKMRDEYLDVIDPATGLSQKDEKGEVIRRKTGKQTAQGFNDQDYLWQIRVRTLNRINEKGEPEWGLRITKCKADISLVGLELWGRDCHFSGLMETVYPHIPLKEWGL